MDEKRFQEYLQLIQELLSSSNGEKAEILQANSELVDEGLVKVMLHLAEELPEENNTAQFLRNLAEQIAGYLAQNSTSATSEEYLQFLMSVLLVVFDNPNPESVYPLFQGNLNKLDENLGQILELWATEKFKEIKPEEAESLAGVIANFSILIQQFPLGNQAMNLEIAITGYQVAAQIFTETTFPQDWAATQNNLGAAYSDRIRGDKAQNVDAAITAYQKALRIRTETTFPQDWAMTQNNLGNAYSDRITGDKAQNLDAAITAYENALCIYTETAFPQQWATTQNNLGNAYKDRITGDKAQNLDAAITAYQKALRIRTETAFPQDWAATQNNLGNAYSDRITGDKAQNLDAAITAYQKALRILTETAFPQDWAATQNNLGNAYNNRIRGDKAQNVDAAITAFQKALRIRTETAFPQDWAATQNNLGAAYWDRITGDKAQNVDAAITAFQNALRIYTETAFPQDWAATQNNLGAAYSDRIRGDKAQNLDAAITAFQNALRIRTETTFPQQWAKTQNNLGVAYWERITGDKAQNVDAAITAYEKALRIRTETAFPQQWAMTQNNLGIAYNNRIRGDKAQNVDAAITAYEKALRIRTLETLPLDFLNTISNLGNLYFKNQNWKKAIPAYQQAIQAVEMTRTWALNDNRRQEIISEGIRAYINLVVAAINNKQFNLALETVERSRSLGLVDLMESSKVGSSGEIAPELNQHLQDYELLQQRINGLRMPQASSQGQVLVAARDSGNAKITEADLEAIEELETEKQQIWQKMRRLDPILAGQKQVDPLNLSQMQSLIDNEVTALLSFYTTNNDTYIFILKAGQSPQVYTCEGQGIEALQYWIVDNWLNPYLAEKNQWFAKMGDFLTQLSQRLQIKDLIAQHLTEIEELIIVPHLTLHQIPFAALPVDFGRGVGSREKGREDLTTGYVSVASKDSKDNRGLIIKSQPQPTKPTSQPSQYLSDRFRLRVVPSCQILHYCHQRPAIDSQIMGMVEDATEDLVYTSYECETIAQQYQIPTHLRLRGNQATTSNYRHLSQQVNILHSSHHASAELDNPLDSKLLLADGFLTLGQLFSPGWRMPNLSDVFASCCEVNFTITDITDDMFTLATGFLCAGARNVVSTLWSVDDFATALLAIFYYDSRSQGITRSQSLQQAQQKLRNLTGKELTEKYQTQLHNHLQQRQTQINEALETAKAKGNEEKVEKLQQLAGKITIQKEEILPYHCQQEYPFASPFYWAGFVSQGLA